eukprot:gnl/MRDRNA2_/MRDRNA2_99224_c0_seq1.p1 gnl/MRDRNA2_/MRDRNA2_99224_c0~~gnl/MRDRNA2_/MRDRNA2_99224_c0_seq1.p1  ORF type:complete len:600 (-),score=93.66 gnl/MRDRNA2_/MRDRNA2_99224_c0_seq1:84-1883(-)
MRTHGGVAALNMQAFHQPGAWSKLAMPDPRGLSSVDTTSMTDARVAMADPRIQELPSGQESIRNAQSHLVLLKSKMRQKKAHRTPRSFASTEPLDLGSQLRACDSANYTTDNVCASDKVGAQSDGVPVATARSKSISGGRARHADSLPCESSVVRKAVGNGATSNSAKASTTSSALVHQEKSGLDVKQPLSRGMHGGSTSPTGRPRERHPRQLQNVSRSPCARKSLPNSVTGYPNELRQPVASLTSQEKVPSKCSSGPRCGTLPTSRDASAWSQAGGYPVQHSSQSFAPTSYGGSPFASSPQTPRNGLVSSGGGDIPSANRGSAQSLIRCDTCGRSFNPESIEKHVAICEKIFHKKRKPYDFVAARLGDLENANQLIENAKKMEHAKPTSSSSSSSECGKQKQKDNKPLPKWKQQSLQFRQAILAAKGNAGDKEAQVKAEKMQRQLQAAGGAGDDPDMQRCPHCDRTFNKIAAERHIPICQKTFGSKPGGGRLLKGGGRVCAANAAHTGQASCESSKISGPSGAQNVSESLQRTSPAGRNSSVQSGTNLVSSALTRKSSATPSSATRSRSGSVHLTSSNRRDVSSSVRPNLGAPQRMIR